MSVTRIDYDEPDSSTYKSVSIVYGIDLEEKKVFDSGDFVKDWYDCQKFTILELQDEHAHSNSSSVDHFLMDGAEFDTMYLKTEEDGAELISEAVHGIEFFVEKGKTYTWVKLRKRCGDEKDKIG